MSAPFAARLVRGWLGVYTRGLPAEVAHARIEEIESDVWSERVGAASRGQSDRALAREIVGRLVLGMPADVTWRLTRASVAPGNAVRTPTTGTTIVALLAVVGGLALTVFTTRFALAMLAKPDAHPWDLSQDLNGPVMSLVSEGALVALSLSLGGIAFILIDRIHWAVALAAELGAVGALLGVLGAYSTWVLLPVGSLVAIPWLARTSAVHWALGLLHAVSAAAFLLVIESFLTNAPVGWAPAILLLGYPVSWIGIGLQLIGGLPPDRRTAPPVT